MKEGISCLGGLQTFIKSGDEQH